MDENTIIERLVATEERSKSNSHRSSDMETTIKEIAAEQKAIYKLATSIEVIAQRVSNIDDKVDSIGHKVDMTTQAWQATEQRLTEKMVEAENRPAKDTAKNLAGLKLAFITAILTAIGGGIGAWIFSLFR